MSELPEGFKSYDTSPIVTREIHFKHYSFGVREVILAIIGTGIVVVFSVEL